MFQNQKLLNEINKLPADWHGCGSMSNKILETILFYSEQLEKVKYTAETGAGKTTLLFSNIALKHTVFAIDNYGSLSVTKNSTLLKKDRVEFVEGPSQKTLPKYNFIYNFDIVLLDGPHGYPFPEIEYFYFYPLIREGGLLLIDDIGIPSIARMFDILKADDMWELLDEVEKLAVFKRTDSPLIDPYSDSWWLQGYNRSAYLKMERKVKIKHAIRPVIFSISPHFFKKIILRNIN